MSPPDRPSDSDSRPPSTPAVSVRGLSKSFGPTRALVGADLEIAPGEVAALMGANGAGKSTLVKILSGSLSADAGSIELAGRPISFASPREAKVVGIATVHQATDQGGAPGLSVAENLMLDELCGGGPWLVGRRSMRRRAEAVAALLSLDLPLDRDFGELRPAERQLVTIARAVAARPSILILDEPTSSLAASEAERLFAVIRRLRETGIAVLYISHRLGDLAAIADRAIVLRGGRVVDAFPRPIDLAGAVSAMIGRSLETAKARIARDGESPVVLEVRNAQLIPGAEKFDLRVGAGEVVAITGALGSGKSRFLRSLFGLETFAKGQVTIDGREWRPRGPGAAISAGVFMVAEDRWRSSLLPPATPGATIAGTIALPHLARWFPSGLLRSAREHEAAETAIDRLRIVCRGPDDTLDQLSGGNQQKVVLARWQAVPCRLLLLDEPFQGIDVGARADLIRAIREDESRPAVLIATSDAEEALEVADRILVMRDHAIVGELGGEVVAERSAVATIGRVEAAEIEAQ